MFIHPHKFPDISFEDFQEIDDEKIRQMIAERNRILNTDTYNRTMRHTRGEKGLVLEAFSGTMRRSPNGQFIVMDGVGKAVSSLLAEPITGAEFRFARDVYDAQKTKNGNSYFDEKHWNDIVEKQGGRLDLTVKTVRDGTVLKPGEPYIFIEGPGEDGAHFEAPLLRAFYKTAVATDAREIEELLGSDRVIRVIEVGKRSGFNEEAHMDAISALYTGAGITQTCNDAAAAVYDYLITGGTMAHRYLASYSLENDAFEEGIRNNDKISLLIDLVDSLKGIDKAVALKKKYRANKKKSIFIRLDSGDIKGQVIYALNKMKDEFGGLNPAKDKIIVEDISSIQDIRDIEEAVRLAGFKPEDFILYGLGGLLVAKNKTRDTLSAAYKLIWNLLIGNTGKGSNAEIKRPIPGHPNIQVQFLADEIVRQVVQESEEKPEDAVRLLETVYDYKTGVIPKHVTMKDGLKARERVLETRPWITNGPVQLSEETARISKEVQLRLAKM